MKKNIAIVPAIALIVGLALTGCSVKGSNTGVAKADDKPAAAAPAAEEKPTNPAFGETYTYKDGVTITVSAPAEVQVGEYAAGADQAHNVAFTFTITNGSKENLDPLVFPKVSSAGTEASSITDIDNPAFAAYAPTTVILPGGTSTFALGYSVADPANLIVQVSPGAFGYEDAIFTNVAS